MAECARYSVLCVLRAQCDFIEPDQPDATSPVPSAKTFPFPPHPNHLYIPRHPIPQRGVSRSSRTWGGMRWTRQRWARKRESQGGLWFVSDSRRARRTTLIADGEAVWFWHPLLVSSSRRQSRPDRVSMRLQSADDGDKTNSSPGRARRKPLKPLRREGRVIPVHLWFRTRVLSTFAHEAVGANRAPGFPCALCFLWAHDSRTTRALRVAGMRRRVFSLFEI